VRSGSGAARTILLFHIISARPFKQPRMVRTFLKVYMERVSYFLFLQEQQITGTNPAQSSTIQYKYLVPLTLLVLIISTIITIIYISSTNISTIYNI